MRALAANGEIPRALDVSANLQSALDLIRAAREAGQALGRYLADRFGQLDAFSGEAISPETEAFLRNLYRDEGFTKPRKPDEIAAALSDYARQAMAVTPGPNLFGETADGSTARQIHRGLNERFASGDAGRIDLRAPGKAEQPAEPQAGVALLDLPAPRGEGRDGGGQGLRPENGAETPAAQQEPRAGPSARLTARRSRRSTPTKRR
jgi:hypothetical protein